MDSYFNELVKISEPVRKQFENVPNSQEFSLEETPFGGVDEKLRHKELSKGLERLYPERVVLRATNYCQRVCSFCYELPRINKKPYHLDEESIDKAVGIIEDDSEIDYVLISGGSPFNLGAKRLNSIISKLYNIDHIKQIYVAGSRPIFNPEMWSVELAQVIASYIMPDFENPENSKIIGVSTQINHSDELKKIPHGFYWNVIDALHAFTSKGIPVYCYSTLLKGVNDDPTTLRELFSILRQNNVTPRYLIHAMNTPWNNNFRVPVQKMVDLAKDIEPLSGHIKPLFIAATPIGKVPIYGSMKLEYKIIDGRRHVKFKTPYKKEEFKKSNRLESLPPKVEVDTDDRLIIYYNDGE